MNKVLAAAISAVVCAGIAPAQSQNSGCDGPVKAKTSRSGPCSELARKISEVLADPAVARAHWGIKVTAMDGAPIYSLNDGQLFQPASNTKMFTTATALALLGANTTFTTKVISRGTFSAPGKLTGDVVLVGAGDANLSGRVIPYVPPSMRPKVAPGQQPPPAPPALRYLKDMADQVAKTGLKVINGDIVGDDTLYPWEPYPSDWSIDDAVWGYGAPVSALVINDNQLQLTVAPGDAPGKPTNITIDPIAPYYTVDATALVTGPHGSGSHVQIERAMGSKVLRIYGSIAVDARPDEEEIAIHDPAEYAAAALKSMLEVRGILVTGVARAKHRISTDARGFFRASHEPILAMDWSKTYAPPQTSIACVSNCSSTAPAETVLAQHISPPLIEDMVVTNKVSQNLHAEMFLHNLGAAVLGDGSTVGGARVIRAFLTTRAGLDPDDFIFFDGSGLSGHDLVTPRATARLLQYAATQPWFADWKRTLPIGGEDGSLVERFGKAPLKDHVFAKTGTLSEARALSGYLDCASGKAVIFSVMVSAHSPATAADRIAMDKIVGLIAAAN
ncbi:D-alanyl-D-alanine carboxypeptidase/D-alanyl-D-alanine endopeptidase [Edaphobacter albus]|uniref:D-alanyl-D-alanine carboxypeptidase/D-alanyl-D-alanine endopeptidase n=1 Tax=Edaphobacter sp. 4G125 TaxID=2763071 RepID=UPI0016459C1E|nr:D-alanyl-D-alanine carboxypeptidase/D-alanyl-D-alanine-endopeptidase [Edaphobacter sp. 4G125]QNI36742.1 D-alanyl-D-alanine carboxypeptidase/D-alanyl-D-alanine-endopeptidase [Edaphobacter sp. 4G125]